MRKVLGIVLGTVVWAGFACAQVVDYNAPKRYIVNDVKVTGVEVGDPRAMGEDVGIFVGDTILIPGSYISAAIRQLVTVRRYADADIRAKVVNGDRVNLETHAKG